MAVNFESGGLTIETTDGRSVNYPGVPLRSYGHITRAAFLVHESRMDITAAGSVISVNVGTTLTPTPLVVVYLDQNHWVGFARWRNDPTSIDAQSARFFDALATAVGTGAAVTPLSAAHLTETARRGGRSRVDLASTMLTYSSGWQLRDAEALRRGELRAMFGGEPLERTDVVGLDPSISLDRVKMPQAPFGFPPELAGLIGRLAWATAQVAVLTDVKAQPPGTEFAQAWAQSLSALAQHVRRTPIARRHLRELTKVRFLSDLGDDLPAAAIEAGQTPEQFDHWYNEGAEATIAAAPGLSRLRELVHLRVSNADDKWEANDLNDMVYLSYAAAYCDIVVGEKKTISYLHRAGAKVPKGAALYRRPGDAHEELVSLASGSAAPPP
ncbi:hypothetical protein [Demequina phytophila]|uniref:hypothetical protein n=1 Tax=Demequina phytophila TaxID=1638981 RepID=UPI000784CF58|nr:hypothetical protein [Demequina phytophila]